MNIVFIGTGGGRVNLVRQKRLTGGFKINSKSAYIHVDPGPGALIYSWKFKQNPLGLDAIVVSHNHLDHCNDASLMAEAMTRYGFKKRGILIGSKYAIKGKNEDKAVTSYHQSKIKEVYVGIPGKKKKFKTERGFFEMEFIKSKHDEPTAFGFKLKLEGKTIGYTGDTEIYKGIGKNYKGCDVLIANCLKPEDDGIPDHLKTEDVIEILKTAKPKMCILNHLGFSMIKAGPAPQAKKIQKESGIPTFAPKDGQKFNFS
ncbi:MBL fold metallo-hydrolase [Candidatus Micrarchaeota archaeon]|nr:MBL fold metallo-hydrolase [Candidatus Micrarchaeota archaeon]